jgi:ferredoxin
MRVVVDAQSCQGHGLCTVCAPDLLDIDDDGRAKVLFDPVPVEQVSAARSAVETCPEQALSIEH